MKLLLKLTAFFLIAVYLFLSCNKDKDRTPVPPPPPANRPPIANAGPDLSFTLSSCSEIIFADLDGSGSTDPENKILSYNWRKISGPQAPVLINSSSAKSRVRNLFPGEYAYELQVTDPLNLSSRDTMLISVKPAAPKEYDLDISFNAPFKFYDNVADYYYTNIYYDQTEINGSSAHPTLGNLDILISEYTDSAASKYADNSYIFISVGNMNTASIYGNSTVNLKKLIQQGGGPFNGTWKVAEGSAKHCDPTVFANLPPLTVTGNLDTTTRKVTVTIKGKTFL